APRLWGIAALDDQRLGGVIMWVPGSLLYLLAVVAVAVVMLMRTEREEQASTGLLPSPNEGKAQ
ncbi:MAG: cytochrome c oxidase assembly protein, partial [Chloroflexota bacterium]|nr:cytochrome c oxidase assembly protein [Chloroflexota bacterium]